MLAHGWQNIHERGVVRSREAFKFSKQDWLTAYSITKFRASLNRLGGATENARPENDGLESDWKGADFTMSCCRRRRRGISWCCGSRSWTAVLLLLLLLVDVVVVVADLSEKPGAVYPEAVAYGAQKLKFRVCSGIIARDACFDAGVILKISLFLWSTYSNAAFQTLQSLPFCRRRGRNANILVTVTDVTVSLFSTVVIFVAVGAVAVNTAVLVNKCFPIWVHFDTIPFLCL